MQTVDICSDCPQGGNWQSEAFSEIAQVMRIYLSVNYSRPLCDVSADGS